jgi:hypothetical protein
MKLRVMDDMFADAITSVKATKNFVSFRYISFLYVVQSMSGDVYPKPPQKKERKAS